MPSSALRDEAERPLWWTPVYTFPNTSAHHRLHSARQRRTPRPCVSKCRDKSRPTRAIASRQKDSESDARSVCMARQDRRNPGLPAKRFQASADLQPLRRRTPAGIAGDQGLRCEELTFHRVSLLAERQSRTYAHGPDEAAQSGKAQLCRDMADLGLTLSSRYQAMANRNGSAMESVAAYSMWRTRLDAAVCDFDEA